MCNFCAGFAWPPFNPLQKLCQSCAAGSLEQDLCSSVLLSFVSYRNLARILCPSLACNRMCKACAGRAWVFSLTLDRLCESCAARFLVQDLCSCACVPCVWCAKLVRQPCFPTPKTTTDKARFHFYLSFRAARLCKFCAGCAWAFSLSPQKLCESCAGRSFEQELCSLAFVPCVVCKACALTFLASCHNTRFPLYLKLSGDRLCNFCAGFAWPPFNPLQKLCQSCAAGSLEQKFVLASSSFLGVVQKPCADLVPQPCL